MSGSLPIFQQGQVLNAATLNTAFAQAASSVVLTAPGPIGTLTPSAGAFTTLSASTSLTAPSLTMGGTTGTGFGFGIGQMPPPWINYQGGGNPGWQSPSRFIFGRSGAGAQTDVATVQILRAPTFSGGDTNHVNPALLATTTVGANVADQEVGMQGLLNTNSTAGGFGVAGWFQATRNAGATQWIWGGLIAARDMTGVASSSAGQAVIGLEVDANGVRADDQTNSGTYGGFGVRKGVQIACHRQFDDGGIQFEVSNALWISTGGTAGSGGTGSGAPDVNYRSAIGFQVNCQTYSALDTRGAIAPAISTNPMIAVNMTAGHAVDFAGGPNLNSAPQRWMYYDSGLTRWFFMNGATKVASIDTSGNIRAAGTVTGSTAP